MFVLGDWQKHEIKMVPTSPNLLIYTDRTVLDVQAHSPYRSGILLQQDGQVIVLPCEVMDVIIIRIYAVLLYRHIKKCARAQ